VSIQLEYGIFGGPDGAFLLDFRAGALESAPEEPA